MIDLMVPAFARLIDYCDSHWLVEPQRAANLWQAASRLDLFSHVADGAEPLKSAIEREPIGRDGKSIAVIRLNGLLMKGQSSLGGTSTVQARRDIRNAVADPDTAGILLSIDSPGGTSAGTAELADEVMAARKKLPVWAHGTDIVASAAYWVGSQAERLAINSTGHVGSIGTYSVLRDVSGALEKDGVRTLLFATGPLKGLGVPGSKITDEQAAHVQSIVDGVQSHFDAAVRKGRRLNEKELAAVRHGGLLEAKAAQSARLVDGVEPLERTLAEFTKHLRSAGGVRQRAFVGATSAFGRHAS